MPVGSTQGPSQYQLEPTLTDAEDAPSLSEGAPHQEETAPSQDQSQLASNNPFSGAALGFLEKDPYASAAGPSRANQSSVSLASTSYTNRSTTSLGARSALSGFERADSLDHDFTPLAQEPGPSTKGLGSRLLRQSSRVFKSQNSHDLRRAVENYGKVNLRGVQGDQRKELAQIEIDAQRSNLQKLLSKGDPVKQSSKSNDNALHKAARREAPSGTVLSTLMKGMNADQQKSALTATNKNGEQPVHLFMKKAGTLALQAKVAGERADKFRQAAQEKFGDAFEVESSDKKTRDAVKTAKAKIERNERNQRIFQHNSDGFKQQAEALSEHGKNELGLTEESQQSLLQQRSTSGQTPQDLYEAAQSPEAKRALETSLDVEDTVTEAFNIR